MPDFSILIVDEDNENRAFLAKELSREGRRLIDTSCTCIARKIIDEQSIDMVILDTGTGKHCGFGFLRGVFHNQKAPHIPVFLMSNRTDLSTKLLSYLSGALRFFSKPVDLDELLSSI